MAFEKHRDEKENYEIDFRQNRLSTGEALSTVTLAKVRKRTTLGWDDVTAEFGTLAEGISGDKVQFILNPASGSDQQPGVYQVLIKVLTDLARDIVATKALTVTGRASV